MQAAKQQISKKRVDPAELVPLLEKEGTVFLDSSILEASTGREASSYGAGWHEDRGLFFTDPVETLILDAPEGIWAFFSRLEAALSKGLYAAGWLSYEAGCLLNQRLKGLLDGRWYRMPLAWFGIYDRPLKVSKASMGQMAKAAAGAGPERAHAGPFSMEQGPVLDFPLSRADFKKDIKRIHDYIAAGDTYQVNYTIHGAFQAGLPPEELYFALRPRQMVGYGAFVNCGELKILSFSPELFFKRRGRVVCSMPMKGTMPRGRDEAEDRLLSKMLYQDEKNRAENVMIVDLIRNDLGRIAETGSVKVPELFKVERYRTLLQMISIVEARLRPGLSWAEIFRGLFPCGSITGAPKIRTMEIIRELERGPRGVYTGAIGYICPDGDAAFNVAIRTLEMRGGKGILGVGAGITIGSDPEKELEETILKAKFLTNRVRFRGD